MVLFFCILALVHWWSDLMLSFSGYNFHVHRYVYESRSINTFIFTLLLSLSNTTVLKYSRFIVYVLLYSRKYWRSLILMVWPKTKSNKYWRNLNLAVAPHSVLHHEQCAHVYQGALLSSRLKYLNKAVTLQIYKKYNWQCAGAKNTMEWVGGLWRFWVGFGEFLAGAARSCMCNSCRGAPGGTKNATACMHYFIMCYRWK